MKKNNKKQTKSQNKRFLIFILAFISIFIITIPLYYVIEYNNNKVTPFVEEVTKLEEDGYKVIKMKGEEFKEFDFKLVCKDFDITTRYAATFTAEIDITDTQIRNIKMQVSLCANWIKFNEKTVGQPLELRNGKYNSSINVNNLKPLVEKTNKLLPLPEATAYVLLTYDRGPSSNTQKNAYLLEYQYGTFEVLKGGYKA